MHRGIGSRNRLQVIMSGKLPGNIIIWLAAIFRVVLWREQVHRIVAIGLVEPDDVSASGIRAIFQGKGRLRAAHLNVLAHEPADKLGNARGIALIRGNQEGVRRFLETLAIGVKTLVVEISQQRVGIRSGIVERSKGSRFVVIDVVARRPGEAPDGGGTRRYHSREVSSGASATRAFSGSVTNVS